MEKQPQINTIKDLGRQQAAASQINKLTPSQRNPGPESDDRDIVHGTTAVDHGRADVPLSAMIDEVDTDYVMDPEKMDYERFMTQTITIHCHDAGSIEDPQFAEVTVNGVYKLIVRGDQADIPRAHAEVLARAKHMRVQQVKMVNPDGSVGFQEKAILKHTYPFSVLHDPAGRRGADWLKQLFRNPG